MCAKYQFGPCPDYDTCKLTHSHPPRCRNMLNHGKCRFGDNCRYHHPKMCYNSMRERKCSNQQCRFFHLTRTNRDPEEEPIHQRQPNHQERQTQPNQSTQNQYYRSPDRQPPDAEESFLSKHIKQTSETMKKLHHLISNFINNQNQQEPQNYQNYHQNYYPTPTAYPPQTYVTHNKY